MATIVPIGSGGGGKRREPPDDFDTEPMLCDRCGHGLWAWRVVSVEKEVEGHTLICAVCQLGIPLVVLPETDDESGA